MNINIKPRDITAWLSESALIALGLLHPQYLPEVLPLLIAGFLGHSAVSSGTQTEKVSSPGN